MPKPPADTLPAVPVPLRRGSCRGPRSPIDKPDVTVYTRPEPLGVIAAITPWNSPLMLATCKLAPPLAAGNTVVLKPFEFTFASSVTLARVFGEVGFPPGVRTVVTGFGVQVGVSLVAHRTALYRRQGRL